MDDYKNLIKFINQFKTDETVFLTIYSSFYSPKLSYNKSFQYIQTCIDALINYFKQGKNSNFFKSTAKKLFKEIEIFNIDFENIIIGFNKFTQLFITKFLSKLREKEIIEFIRAINIFLVYLTIDYTKKFRDLNETIIDNISLGLIVLDNNLNVLKTNRKFFEIIGEEKKNIEGKKLMEILKDREGIPIEKLKYMCETQKGLNEFELIVIRKTGEKLHRTIYADFLIDENGNNEGFIVYIKDTDYMQYLKETFSKYLSKQIAEKILSDKEVNLKGDRKKVAVMFVDIRNFTEFSENNDPEFVLDTLNRYFELIIDIVFKYGGTLDKFVGDAIMVIFGAPVEYEDIVDRCIKCAIEIQNEIKNFNIKNEPKFSLGIGINYGDVIVGNIGSKNKRVEYTAIGDTVNTADRVQKITPGGKIYITKDVLDEIKEKVKYKINFIGDKRFKGKKKIVKVYEICL